MFRAKAKFVGAPRWSHGTVAGVTTAFEDDNDWGEAVRPSGPRKRLDAVISVRFSPEELDILYKATPQGDIIGFIKKATLVTASALGESADERAAQIGKILDEHKDVVDRLRAGDVGALGELLEVCTGAKIVSESVRVLAKVGVQSS